VDRHSRVGLNGPRGQRRGVGDRVADIRLGVVREGVPGDRSADAHAGSATGSVGDGDAEERVVCLDGEFPAGDDRGGAGDVGEAMVVQRGIGCATFDAPSVGLTTLRA
jgi:hypothetical protein